ncbi:MAG: long-chain acyl-CoA synthetase [Candidatus Poriferisodalaceae bacterium]|jgi:long-chain acyl-CoA synthetase
MYPGAFVATTPDKPAVIMGTGGQVITYAELDAAANRLSRVFAEAGLVPGDHVAFCLENHPQFLAVAWGAHYAGLIYTAMSSRLTTDEMAYIVENSGAQAFITSLYKREQAADLSDQMPAVVLRLMLDGTIDGYDSFEDTVAARSAEPLEDRIAGTDMLYSSGTTGRPKGITQHIERQALETAEDGLTALATALFGATSDSMYLSPAPMYHAAPLRFCLRMHMIGATVVMMERFDAEDYLRLVEQHQITLSQVVPTMFVRMLKLDETTRGKYDVSSLETVIHAAAPCPVPVKEKMIEWFGPVIHEYYAGTEGNGFVYCNSAAWLAHKGTVGQPINCVVHICNDEGDEIAVGEAGTIFFEAGGEFEYHGDPEKTAGSRHPMGWSTLGDIGRLDDDGFLYLTDRKAHMIISGGVNIYPQEAENVLTMHPSVVDVAVIGVPNEDFGEEVKAIVQPIDGIEAGPELERELIAYCREQLSDVKCPRTVDFRAELPRHPTGKLYKRLLKDEYWAGHEGAI